MLLVTGPPGAGKSAAARQWAELPRNAPGVHISLDDIRDWMGHGYADPQRGWSPAASRQYAIARSICAEAARQHRAAGHRVVVDDAVFPDWPEVGVGHWRRLLGPGVNFIVLLPSLDAVLERNERRSGHRRLERKAAISIYGRMEEWRNREVPIVDNTDLTIAETAMALASICLPRRAGLS